MKGSPMKIAESLKLSLVLMALSCALPSDAWAQGPGFREKPEIIPDFAQARPVLHGEVRILWYTSKAFAAPRRMRVYTPPGYEKGGLRYPVAYLLHGGGGDDATWMNAAHAEFILDNLIASGKARPMIVVMPPAGPVDPKSDTFAGDNTPEGLAGRKTFSDGVRDTFLADLTSAIVPFVDRNFRTLADRDDRAVAGYSFGGAETIWAATRDLDKFSWFGVFSMGVQIGSTAPPNAVAGSGVAMTKAEFVAANPGFFAHPTDTNARLRYLLVAVGKDDRIVGNGPSQLDAVLTDGGIKHSYVASEGGHDFTNWQVYLRDFLGTIFQPKQR